MLNSMVNLWWFGIWFFVRVLNLFWILWCGMIVRGWWMFMLEMEILIIMIKIGKVLCNDELYNIFFVFIVVIGIFVFDVNICYFLVIVLYYGVWDRFKIFVKSCILNCCGFVVLFSVIFWVDMNVNFMIFIVENFYEWCMEFFVEMSIN